MRPKSPIKSIDRKVPIFFVRGIGRNGFTLIELLITMAIAATLATLSYVGITGYLARQSLQASAQNLAVLLERAQIEASKGLPVCLNFANVNTTGTVAMFRFPTDDEAVMSAAGACSASTVGIIALGDVTVAKKSVGLATSASCQGLAAAPSCVLWIRKDGVPFTCANSSGCLGAVPSSGCTSAGIGIQFVLSHAAMASGARSKEVEITEAGIVHIAKLGQKGYLESAWARFDGDGGAAGSCE